MRQQLKVITLADNSQYEPMKDVSIGGIVMVRNLKPGNEELVEPVAGMLKRFFIQRMCYKNSFLFQLLDQRVKMRRNPNHQSHSNGLKTKS